MSFDIKVFQRHLLDAQIAILGDNVHGSQTLMSYGWEIRKRLYGIGIRMLKDMEFSEVSLSDWISPNELSSLNSIARIIKNYLYIEVGNFYMAASHEITAYLFAKKYLKYFPQTKLPLNFFHIGSVYRYSRNTKFPFSYGERKSFLECYSIHDSENSAKDFLSVGCEWNRKIIQKILKLPSIEVERPLITNKPTSRKTICIDSLTPFGATIITGMTYFHDDIFTGLLSVKQKNLITRKNQLMHSVHFGISDNIFFSYLLNAHDEQGFYLLSELAPYQVSIIYDMIIPDYQEVRQKIINFLEKKQIRYEIKGVKRSKIKKAVRRNMLCGIPVTILVCCSKKSGVNIKILTKIQQHYSPSLSFEKIPVLLKKNDDHVYKKFREQERSSIVQCDSVNEADNVVQSGKIAKVFLNNCDKNITDLESKLRGGEILGFKTKNKNIGKDIITGCDTSIIAFISRRI